jgi:hypothetical protein
MRASQLEVFAMSLAPPLCAASFQHRFEVFVI